MKNYFLSLKDRLLFFRSRYLIIVRIKVFVLLCCLNYAKANTIAQTLTISKQNVRIVEVFREIKKQTGNNIICSSDIIKETPLVSVKVEDGTLSDVLAKVLYPHGLNFKKEDKNIIIIKEVVKPVPKEENKIVSIQQIVRGKVTDSGGEGIAGVSIAVKGKAAAAASSDNGSYEIAATAGETLVFSSVGFNVKEVLVGTAAIINVQLEISEAGLDEVVVVGYGTQKKVNLTGAVESISSEVLENRPLANLAQGLQGQISNLNINQNTGMLGGGASFNLRGTTSINGGGPLILVDNVPMDINLVNPNDVESVTVLKDASSAAIYGARAAYGVILVTTKSGKAGDKPIINLSYNYSVNTPVVKFETMDVLERMQFMNTANIARNGVPYYQFTELEEEHILAHYNDPTKPGAFPDPKNPNTWLMSANTDWPDMLLRDSYPQQQYAISISGAKDRFNYYTSLNYHHQEGIAKQFDEKFERFNFLTNLKYDITKWAVAGARMSWTKSDKIYPPNNSAGHHPEDSSPFQWHQWANMPVYWPDGNYANVGSVPNMVQFHREAGYRSREIDDTWLTGSLLLTPIPKLQINLDYSFNMKNLKEEEYWKRLPMYYVDGSVSGYFPYTNPSQITKGFARDKFKTFNVFADYEVEVSKHQAKLMVGYNQEGFLTGYFNSKRENLTVESIPYLSLAHGEKYVNDSASEYTIRGVFTRFNYNYDDRYLFEFNGRYDGSSRFPKNDRFAFFPSFSAGWRIDNEPMLASLKDTFSLLKLRGSYGNLGNQTVNSYYPYIPSFTSGTVDFLFDERPLTVYAPGLVSPTLTWETVEQKNIGLDATLLNNKLDFSFDMYRRDTKKMLTKSQTLPAVLAVGEPLSNAADLKTTGFELTVGWKEYDKDFKWGVKLILSDYTSSITKYNNPAGLISDHYVGKKFGDIWGLVTDGIAQTDEQAKALDLKNIVGYERKAGDLTFIDLDGDGKITYGNSTLENPGDRKVIGNSLPRYSFGFKTDFSYKNFDVDIFFQGVAKRDVWLDNSYWLNGYIDEWAAQNKLLADWWSPENTGAYFPRPTITGGSDVTAVQTRFLQNAAYLRLKQLNVGYSFSPDWISRVGIKRMKVYVSGNNLWETTKIHNYKKLSDPEMNGARFYPIHRSFSFGINISL